MMNLAPDLLDCQWLEKPSRRKITGDRFYKKKIIFDTDGVIYFKVNHDISKEQREALHNCPIVEDLHYDDTTISFGKGLKVTKPKYIAFSITIPKNFICDSTSLPWADDINGDLHDCGYGIQGGKWGFTKEFWDLCYRFSMQFYEFPKALIFTRYYGVKWFGGNAYKTRRNEKYDVIRRKALSNIINRMGI